MYNPNEAPPSHQLLYYELFEPVSKLIESVLTTNVRLSVSNTLKMINIDKS